MKKILTISRTSPEVKSGSGYVMNQFIRFFSEDEMVFLCEDSSQVRHANDQIFHINTNIIRLKRGGRFFRWHRWLILQVLIKKISILVTEKKCNSILCVYPDEIYLIAGFLAAKKLNLKFYPYFHNLYYENKKGLSKIIARHVQKMIFAQSEFVYLISYGLHKELAVKYPKTTFRVLTHPIHGDNNIRSEPLLSKKNDKIVLTFLGNINDSNIDALKYVIETLETKTNLTINLITKATHDFLYKKGLIKKNVLVNQNIKNKNIKAELDKSDFLLLPHGFKGALTRAEYRSAFPTKTLQYLLSSSPILSILPSDCYLYTFLKENQCAFCITQKDKNDLLSIFEKLEQNKDEISLTVYRANKTAVKFNSYEVLTDIRENILI
jgi:hypothetical protein